GDFSALRRGGGVAPEFGGPDDGSAFIERNETVLLAADANGFDFSGAGLRRFESLADAFGSGSAPDFRMLFFGSGRKIGDESIGLRGGTEHGAIPPIHYQHLGRLR